MKSKKLFKKLSLTFLGLAGLATGTIALIPNNFSNNNQLTLDSSTQQSDVKTTSSNLSVQSNDSYNTFNSESGYLSVDQSSTLITFSNWFGFKVWSFNVNENSKELFGSQRTASNIKVRALDNLQTVLVYGDLDSNNSFMFQLNLTNGSIHPVSGKNSLVGTSEGVNNDSTIIPSVNVANVTDDNYVILSPKINLNNTFKVTFSVVSLTSYNQFTNNKDYSKTTSNSTSSIDVFYEITGAIKKTDKSSQNTYYVFSVKGYNTTNNGTTNTFTIRNWMMLFRVVNDAVTTADLYSSSCSNAITVNNGNTNVQDFINEKYMNNMEFVTGTRYNYSSSDKNLTTILTTIKWKEYWDIQSQFLKNNLFGVNIDANVVTSTGWTNTSSFKPTAFEVAGNANQTSAPIDLVWTEREGITRFWVVCQEIGNQNQSDKISLVPIEPSVITQSSTITSSYWMDLQTNYTYPEFEISFIPNSTYTTTANILGLINWNEKDAEGGVVNSKSFKFLNATTQATVEDVSTYALTYSDQELNDKYKDSITTGIEEQIAKDASSMTENGTEIQVENLNYSNLKVSDDLKNVSGTITFDVKSWFNSPNATTSSDYKTSKITRNIMIGDFNSSKPNSSTGYIFPGLNNDILAFSLIVSAALIIVGLSLFTFKHFKNKKVDQY